jgi:hypothetical protein
LLFFILNAGKPYNGVLVYLKDCNWDNLGAEMIAGTWQTMGNSIFFELAN